MDNNTKLLYKTPQMKILEIELESSILTVSGDPTIANPDMEWGAKERRGSWDDPWITND